MRRLLTALFGILIAAAPAAAQDEKPVGVNFGFGWTFPTADFKKSFDAGWNGAIGATFHIHQHLGIQGEYMYTHMNGPDRTIQLSATPVDVATNTGIIQSNHQMHVGTFNLVYRTQSQEHPIGGYVLGGGGIYHRIVQLTTPSVGYTTVCDPYWYWCYPAAVSVDQIIGDRSSNDFGINLGGGFTFGHEVKFYIESRYHYVWGKTIRPPSGVPTTSTTPCASGCTTNAAYFPLTFGVKF
jgi:hypothetical protein